MSTSAALLGRAPAAAPAASAHAGDRRPFGLAAAGAPLRLPEGVAYFAIAAVIDIVVGLRSFPMVLDGSLVNPDTYMRLVRLRDILAQHAPLDIVARDGGGAGTLLHWSHLIDGLLLLFAAPLSLVMSEEQALHWVVLAFGPAAIGLLALAAVWAMAPFTHPRWRWLGPLLAGLSPGIVGFAVPGEVHHHIPVAAASVMTAGWALRSAWLDADAGWKMGGWAAVGIWLTPESMPFILAAFGGLGLFWLLHPENSSAGAALRSAGASFLLLVAAALAVDPPFGGYTAAPIERLSIVYVALAAVVFLLGWVAARLDRRRLSPLRRSVVAALAALAGFGAWFSLFPEELAGPYGLLSATDTRLFFGVISDMQPIVTAPEIAAYLGGGVLATLAAGVIAVQARSPVWGFAALCALLTIVLGVVHRRFATYPEIVAVAMLPVILSAFDDAPGRQPRTTLGAARLAVLAICLLAPQSGALGNLFAPKQAIAGTAPGCDPRTLQSALAPYAGQIVLSDPGDTPGLLYWTQVLTVGSLFHRDIGAFLRLRAAWRSASGDSEPDAVRATHAALVLVCPQAKRSLLVADLPPDTLLDRLNADNPPPWLVPIDTSDASPYRLYRITNTRDATH